MTLVAVQGSSYVAAAGYEDGTIRVKFLDGRTRDFPNQPPEMYAALMVAPSKGRFLVALGQSAPEEPPKAKGPMDTYAHDECCSKHLVKALRAGKLEGVMEWPCPQCGCFWLAERIGEFRHWKPQSPWVVITP